MYVALLAVMAMSASTAHAQSTGITFESNSAITRTSADISNGYLFGIYQIQSGANGGGGQDGASTSNGVTVINDAHISLSSSTPLTGGAALWATDQGGNGGGDGNGVFGTGGGSSSGVTIINKPNNGLIVAEGSGSTGFAGIQGLSFGGNGYNYGGGGNGGPVSVSSAMGVTTNWTWVNAGSANSGVWGVMADSSGGQGGLSLSGNPNNNGGYGGQGGAATVTLTEFGDVKLTVAGTPPSSASSAPSAAVAAISMGGSGGYVLQGNKNIGGGGGSAGMVTISNTDAVVSANGIGLPALLAYGAGGAGGYAGAAAPQASVGDPQENGGNGGNTAGASITVNAVKKTVSISTTASGAGLSPVVSAVQVGGAGGYGGYSFDTGLSTSQGGNGGAGGSTGSTSVFVTGTGGNIVELTTDAARSAGINASSTGGAGAYGGNADTAFAGHSQGGNGGAGGASGDIGINVSSATIQTQHSSSPGILARSEGGVGGSGGSGSAGTGHSNGGNGGAGGASGNIFITTDSNTSIKTVFGSDAEGILAQTLSGSAGNGDFNNSTFGGTAGSAGAGGSTGAITITNSASISTVGTASRGILAQAMAGSGGLGGASWSIFSSGGGPGGNGGTAGNVTVANYGNITTGSDPTGTSVGTMGVAAQGILMQSIGGGGGAGGVASGVMNNIGGAGGAAANGGTVNFANHSGNISTSGTGAVGIEGQSIGGGGGDGGGSSGIKVVIGGTGGDAASGGTVNATSSGGSISTTGDISHGVLFQSIGGGGGSGGDAIGTGVQASMTGGGSAGSGGNGQDVSVDFTNTSISTSGFKSAGLIAQSIGGGGGTGGRAYGTSIGAVVDVSEAFGGSGGGGGSAATAEATLIGSTITTGQSRRLTLGSSGAGNCEGTSSSGACNVQVIDSHGVIVQSIGGGGGHGGSATAQAIAVSTPIEPGGTQLALAASFAVGGSGGAGGDGGWAQFSMSNGASIKTSGAGSTGALVQSIGGGGGDGGDGSAMSAASGYGSKSVPDGASAPGVAITTTVGGSGGTAGNGGSVWAAVGAQVSSTTGAITFDDASMKPTSIVTYGDYADGLKVQSIGGGGGDADVGSSSTQDFGTGSTSSLSINVGSVGASGGNGGTVNVYVQPGYGITTWGSSAIGILAQSIGGGGGTSQGGSFGIAQSFSPTKNTTVKPGANISLGNRDSKSGGVGGQVGVSVQAPVVTHGNDAAGVLAQSIGGGGGVGGSSGSDGSGDNPVVEAFQGREFQSNAGGVADGTIPQVNPTLNVAVGGTGGTGGTGGEVQVYLASTIMTSGNPVKEGGNRQASPGDWSYGILAQSVGGGGGKGGTAMASGTGGDWAEINTYVNHAVGGTGGSGGSGGLVNVYLQTPAMDKIPTAVQTAGYGATGIVAQSIGGGGGLSADGSDVAGGTLSVGGGGVSGTGGSGGSGGTVNLDNLSSAGVSISTVGTFADGIDAQSIGGGGGIAGAGSSIWDKLLHPHVASTMNFVAGGGADASGAGGNVIINQSFLNNPLNVNVSGYGSYGILAQSIGGGGGNIVANQGGSGTPSITLGGTQLGNTSATGGNVLVQLSGNSTITASGVAGIGVLAQSVGSGGGIIRLNDGNYTTPSLTTAYNPAYVRQSAPGSANGGQVQVTSYANIAANGPGGVGIFAQSVGGGGGLILDGGTLYANAPLQGGPGHPCNVVCGASVNGSQNFEIQVLGGSVSATGVNGIGIFAQAAGYGPLLDGTPNLFIGAGTPGGNVTVMGGSGSGSAGIWIDRPAGPSGQNQAYIDVQTDGNVTTSAGSAGTAITVTGGGNIALINQGRITGSLLLNTAGSYNGVSFGTGMSPDASNSNGSLADDHGSLLNKGTWVPGAQARGDILNQGSIAFDDPTMTTHLMGHFIQTGSGRLSPVIDSLNGKASLLQIDGTALVDGAIAPNAISLLPGTVPVLTAGNLGTSPVQAQNSLVFKWDTNTTGNTINITPHANFTPAGTSLTASQSSLAGYNNRAWDASDPLFAKLFAGLSRINDSGDYKSALDSLSSKATHAQAMSMINSAGTILGSSMSCPVFANEGTLMTEDNCVWGQVNGRWTNQSTNGDTQGYNVSGTTYRFGAQHQFAPEWYVGGSLAAGDTDAHMNSGSSGNGNTYDGSVTLKHITGPWQFAGSLAVSHGNFDVQRNVGFDGVSQTLKSHSDATLAGMKLRAGYEFAHTGWYMKPYGDVDMYYTSLPGFTEDGGTPYALKVHGTEQFNVAFTPMLEFGSRIDVDAKTTLRAYAAFGASYRPDGGYTIHSSFVNAGSSLGTFSDHLDTPEVLGKIDVGVQLYRAGGFEAKASYTADLGSHFVSQAATARFAYHF